MFHCNALSDEVKMNIYVFGMYVHEKWNPLKE